MFTIEERANAAYMAGNLQLFAALRDASEELESGCLADAEKEIESLKHELAEARELLSLEVPERCKRMAETINARESVRRAELAQAVGRILREVVGCLESRATARAQHRLTLTRWIKNALTVKPAAFGGLLEACHEDPAVMRGHAQALEYWRERVLAEVSVQRSEGGRPAAVRHPAATAC